MRLIEQRSRMLPNAWKHPVISTPPADRWETFESCHRRGRSRQITITAETVWTIDRFRNLEVHFASRHPLNVPSQRRQSEGHVFSSAVYSFLSSIIRYLLHSFSSLAWLFCPKSRLKIHSTTASHFAEALPAAEPADWREEQNRLLSHTNTVSSLCTKEKKVRSIKICCSM